VTIGRLWVTRRSIAALGVAPGTTTRDLMASPAAADSVVAPAPTAAAPRGGDAG